MKRTKYSDAFKTNALRRLAMPGQTAPALAAELGVGKTLLYRWRRKAGTPAAVTERRTPRTAATPPLTAHAPSEPRPGRRPQDWTDDEKIAGVKLAGFGPVTRHFQILHIRSKRRMCLFLWLDPTGDI